MLSINSSGAQWANQLITTWDDFSPTFFSPFFFRSDAENRPPVFPPSKPLAVSPDPLKWPHLDDLGGGKGTQKKLGKRHPRCEMFRQDTKWGALPGRPP